MSLWGKIAELEREGKGCVVVTVVATEGSAPQALGAKMIVTADGKQFGTVGGGVVEFKAKMVALDIMQTLEPRIMTFELSSEAEEPIGMICGGKMTLFFEPIRMPETVVIFGAGHIGSRLCHLAKFTGFRVIVVDDRDEFANPKNLPDADQIIKMPFTDAIEKINFNDNLYIAIVSRAHTIDLEILKRCIKKKYKYIGMIGSRKKSAEIFKALKENGISDELIKNVHSPIGIPIGGQSPEEIAISIIAEMISVRNKKFELIMEG